MAGTAQQAMAVEAISAANNRRLLPVQAELWWLEFVVFFVFLLGRIATHFNRSSALPFFSFYILASQTARVSAS